MSAYHTQLALEAARPFPLEIGRAVFVARPVSVPVVLQAMADAADRSVAGVLASRARLLAAAFPRAPWWCPWRDAHRAIARLDEPTQQRIFSRILRVPHDHAPSVVSEDPYAELRRQQRALSRPSAAPGGRSATLLLAALTCRARFGESWYFNPDRWPTHDGYVPHAVAWVEYLGVTALEAREKLAAFDARRLQLPTRDQQTELDRVLATAFPGDPLYAAVQYPH